MIIERSISPAVIEASREYPVVAITGPRQSGKTTLARTLFGDHPYLLLEDPDTRRYANEDPRGFLAQYRDGAILDEVQRAPELFSYLQGVVDQDPRPGRFILTGSQQFGLVSRITQSLAGRVAMLTLLPFTTRELRVLNNRIGTLEQHLFDGFYPSIHERKLKPSRWYANYVATYLERDVHQLVSVRDLSTFERFLRMCAARCGQLVNLSSLANDCGITHNTARSWLSVLEASYIVRTVAPHFRNFSKRLIKSPKIYFLDPGLATWLLEIREPQQLAHHPMRGALFEAWVYSELLKDAFNRGERPNLYFWRDRTGLEVDFVADSAGRLIPIEVKSGLTFAPDWLKSMQRWLALAGDEAGKAWLIYGGDSSGDRAGTNLISWREIEPLLSDIATR